MNLLDKFVTDFSESAFEGVPCDGYRGADQDRFFIELKRRAKTQIVDGDESDSDDSVAFIAGDSKVLQKDGMFCVYKDGKRIGEQTVEEE